MIKPFVIAIDGPAASGKGTLARNLAVHYALDHVDTGLTYRAVAHYMLIDNIALTNEDAAISIAQKLDLAKLDMECLSSHILGEAASEIAVLPGLRQILSTIHRQRAEKPPGTVLDGRDVGTVIFPDADVKFYMIADVRNRANRRYHQITTMGSNAVYNDILTSIKRRDERDTNRMEGSLRRAKDAFLLDTTKLSTMEVFEEACQFIRRKRII
ncbi:MAG: cytidylate kinase [Candidatus Tokpelaia sp. JSC085]|nr:MAG: cytidylate kinase [Candidatus Tokpelaia sp. JSC085]